MGEPAEKWSKAQRLAVAGVVAPHLRDQSERTAKRRVARVDKDGNVVGYTTLAEVQRQLLLRKDIELSVEEGVRPERVICANCGSPIEVREVGRVPKVCPDGCNIRCPGFGPTLGICDKRPSRVAMQAARRNRRATRDWMCQSCAVRRGKRKDGPTTFERLTAFYRDNPDASVQSAAEHIGVSTNVVRVHICNWRAGKTDADPATCPPKERSGVKQGAVRGKYRRATLPSPIAEEPKR